MIFSKCRRFENRKTKIVLFFLSNSTQIPSLEAFIIIYGRACLFWNLFIKKLINWERKGNFNIMKIWTKDFQIIRISLCSDVHVISDICIVISARFR